MSMHDLVFGKGWEPASSIELADMEGLAGVLLDPQPTIYSKTYGVRAPEGAQARVRLNWEGDDLAMTLCQTPSETVFEFLPEDEDDLPLLACEFNHVDEMVDLYCPEDGFAAVSMLHEVASHAEDERMREVLQYFQRFFEVKYSTCLDYLPMQHGGLDGSTTHIAARMRELVNRRTSAVAFRQDYGSPDPSDPERVLELRRRGVNGGDTKISFPAEIPDLEIEWTDRTKDQGWLYLRYADGDHTLNFYVPTHESEIVEEEEADVVEAEIQDFLDAEAEIDEFWEKGDTPSAEDVEMLAKVLEKFVIMEQQESTSND
jgi:hypothetical protein